MNKYQLNTSFVEEYKIAIKRERLCMLNLINKYGSNRIQIKYYDYTCPPPYRHCARGTLDHYYVFSNIINDNLLFNKPHIYSFIIKYHQISKNIIDKIKNKNKNIKYLIKYSIFR